MATGPKQYEIILIYKGEIIDRCPKKFGLATVARMGADGIRHQLKIFGMKEIEVSVIPVDEED